MCRMPPRKGDSKSPANRRTALAEGAAGPQVNPLNLLRRTPKSRIFLTQAATHFNRGPQLVFIAVRCLEGGAEAAKRASGRPIMSKRAQKKTAKSAPAKKAAKKPAPKAAARPKKAAASKV